MMAPNWNNGSIDPGREFYGAGYSRHAENSTVGLAGCGVGQLKIFFASDVLAVTGCPKAKEVSLLRVTRCERIDLEAVLAHFQCPVSAFPCTYLGMPLSSSKLKRIHYQP
jgi:hypothetical protein